MNKESRSIGVVLIVTMLLCGCSGNVAEPIFGVPERVTVTTLQAIQGKTGYYRHLIRGDGAGATAEVVLGLAHSGVSPHPFYILVRDSATTPEGAAIRRLQGAIQAGFSREVPQGYVLLGVKEVDIDIRLGQNTPTYSRTLYLFFTTKKGHRVYFPVCITFDEPAYRKFWEVVAAGPKVIGGGVDVPDDTDNGFQTDSNFVRWLKQDPVGGTAPPYIAEIRYPSKGTEPNIDIVRMKQEGLILSAYGVSYQNDDALLRALRVADKITEGYTKTYVDYLVHGSIPQLSAARDRLLQKESGLPYFNRSFVGDLSIFYRLATNTDTINTSYGLHVEYLRLHFHHRNATKETLLPEFVKSAKKGLIIIKNPWRK